MRALTELARETDFPETCQESLIEVEPECMGALADLDYSLLMYIVNETD